MTEKKFRLHEDDVQEIASGYGAGFATDRIMVDGYSVGYCYREKPDFEEDSGWRFFAGDEEQEYIDNPANIGLYDVNIIANYDPDIVVLLESPVESTFERNEEGRFVPVDTDDPASADEAAEDASPSE